MWKIIYRYFTGLHLDGKLRQSRGLVLPRYTDYFWNRYSRKRRALWRNLGFWGLAALTYGLLTDRGITTFAVSAFAPFLAFTIARKILDALTQVTSYADSDGVTERYRVIRPKVLRWIRKVRPPKVRVALPDKGAIPPDIARAIMAENAEDGGEPITNLRSIGETDVTDSTSSRARTIKRSKTRRAI